MTKSQKEIQRLLPILDMAFQAQQIKMAQVTEKIATLKKQLLDIERPRASGDLRADPAVRSGADVRWQRWVQDRKTLINKEMALLMLEKEKVRTNMVKALSKREAAKQLMARATKTAKLHGIRRSSW